MQLTNQRNEALMSTKTIALFLSFLMMGSLAYAQKNRRTKNEELTMKTARLHIDGFTKSKSGAV